ncbi:uncharacterized protein LOC142358387 [Convolutriloba macropyga]|uniref:uncharacterized protein LOC142358387 n=1 Tax=Convolutriloba macropyga TaxID=536237 RepID=UPI003F525A99
MAPSAAEQVSVNSDQAAARMEKRKWQNTARTLNQKVSAAEKLVTLPPEYQGELGKDALALKAELERERRRLSAQGNSIKDMVAGARIKAESCRPDSASIAILASALEDVECGIANMKDDMREEYNLLMDQEVVLSREVEAFCERLSAPAWNDEPQLPRRHEPQLPDKSGHRVAQPSGNGTLLPEVVAFEEFRAEFGDTGNWHEEEHKEFMRILRACKYDYGDAVMVCCERILTGFEREDIIAHARWHQEYVDLEIRKKLALAEWKERRAMQREAAKSAALATTGSQRVHNARSEAEEREWRAKQKEALEEWRRKKEEDAQRLVEIERQKENEQRRAKAKQMELQLQNKALLEEYYIVKNMERESQQEEETSMKSRPRSAPIMTKEQQLRIQERERQLQLKRAKRLQAKEAAQEAAERKQRETRERLAPKVDRDVGRLLSGTTATRQRQIAIADDRAHGIRHQEPGFIRNVQKLGIPNYMRR